MVSLLSNMGRMLLSLKKFVSLDSTWGMKTLEHGSGGWGAEHWSQVCAKAANDRQGRSHWRADPTDGLPLAMFTGGTEENDNITIEMALAFIILFKISFILWVLACMHLYAACVPVGFLLGLIVAVSSHVGARGATPVPPRVTSLLSVLPLAPRNSFRNDTH